jgi:hypothetical protein
MNVTTTVRHSTRNLRRLGPSDEDLAEAKRELAADLYRARYMLAEAVDDLADVTGLMKAERGRATEVARAKDVMARMAAAARAGQSMYVDHGSDAARVTLDLDVDDVLACDDALTVAVKNASEDVRAAEARVHEAESRLAEATAIAALLKARVERAAAELAAARGPRRPHRPLVCHTETGRRVNRARSRRSRTVRTAKKCASSSTSGDGDSSSDGDPAHITATLIGGAP